MELGIKNKLALITASGRGIGKTVARTLAREGASVILNARSLKELEKLNLELSGFGVKSWFFCYDLTLPDGPGELFNFLQKNQLYPDILVHNLGGNLGVTEPLCSLADWQKVQRMNLEVPIELNRLLIPFMQKKQWGRICHVASISGLENQGPPSYCVAKAGLIAYTRSIGRYFAKDGIVINSVLPGAVFTEGGYWDEASRTRPSHV
ncbi:MAG: SDR family oxidoreductase, partial [Parachlamydiales bacterium]